MLENYFIVAFRKLKRNKLSSTINLLGLSIGLTSALFIFLWIINETTFDSFHKNYDQIYRLNTDFSVASKKWVQTPPCLAEDLKSAFPEIIDASRFTISNNQVVKNGDIFFTDNSIAAADFSFFSIFSFPFAKGFPANPLSSPDEIILAEKAAAEYFGK